MTYIFEWVSFYEKKNLTDEIIESPLKKKSTSKKNKNKHAETKRKTWILLTLRLQYSFTIEKIVFSSFLLPSKFVESTSFLKQCNSFKDSSPREDYFLPLVISQHKKMKFPITGFFSKCEEIFFLNKSVMENFIFCAVFDRH